MAQQAGKGFTIHLTASLRAGTRALEELRSQGRILTTNWYNIEVEPIDNHGTYSDAGRSMIFTLKNDQRVAVNVITWKRDLRDVVDGDGGRKWLPVHVYVEKGERMQAYENHVDLNGYPWSRQPECDKPLSGVTWRDPTTEEIAEYLTAIENHDEAGFLKIYYSDLIEWKRHNDRLFRNTGWVHTTLRKAG